MLRVLLRALRRAGSRAAPFAERGHCSRRRAIRHAGRGGPLRVLLRVTPRAALSPQHRAVPVRPCLLPLLRLPLLRPFLLPLPPLLCPSVLPPRCLLSLPLLSLLNSWRSVTSQRREALPAKGKEKEKEKRTGLQKVIVLHLRTDPVKAKITEKEEEARKGSEKVMRLVRAKEFRLFRS